MPWKDLEAKRESNFLHVTNLLTYIYIDNVKQNCCAKIVLFPKLLTLFFVFIDFVFALIRR